MVEVRETLVWLWNICLKVISKRSLAIIRFCIKLFISWYVWGCKKIIRLILKLITYFVTTPISLFIWNWKHFFGHRSSEKMIQVETRRRCDIHTNPMGIEEKLDSLPQLYPPLCVIEDYYVRDSTYTDGDNTKQRNKYENAKRISVEDMIGIENKKNTSDKIETTNNNFQVLTGPPGSGKTVLAKRIAKLAIENGLRTWFLNLKDYSEDDYLSVEDLLINRYLRNESNINIFYNNQEDMWIRRNQDQCLIVIDGLDKAMFPLNYLGTNEIMGTDTKLPPRKLFSLLCSRHFLPGVRLILASRPHSIVSFSPLIRPYRVVFVNDLLEGDVEIIMDEKSDILYESLKFKQPRSLLFAHNPLFLFVLTAMCSDKMKKLQPVPFLLSMLKQYKSTQHYTTEMSDDVNSVERAIAKMTWKKTIKGNSHIKCSELGKYHLRPEQVQNVLFPAIENDGIEWFRLTEDMLAFHFVQITLQELYCVKHVMQKDTFDEFKETIDQLLVRNSDFRVDNDRLASLRNTVCGYISSCMFQGTDKMRDYFLHVFIERIIEDLHIVFGNTFQGCEDDMINMMKNVLQITDHKIIIKIQKKLSTFEFQFEFTDQLDDIGMQNICEMLTTFVTKIIVLRLNCIGFIESKVDELLQCLLAVEKIEHLYLEKVEKLSPRTLECIFKGVLPRVSKVFTLEIHDKHDFETLKRRMDNYDCSRLDKELNVELYCPGKQNYKATLVSTKNAMKIKIPKSKDILPNIDNFEQIKNAAANEAKKMLEGLNCDIDGSVLPKLKFIDDFTNEEIFQYNDRDVYDMEAYPKSKVIDVDELFIHLNSRRNMSICLCGPKGSGKTIIANRMIAQFSSNEKWSILINLDDFNKDKTTCLKEVLIDNFATKHDVFDEQECEKTFQWIVKSPSKCNIMLDNYDRASFQLTTSSSPDVNGKMKPGELLGNLFAKLLLPEANILLISRPYAITQLPSKLRPKSLYFVGNLSDDVVKILFDRFYGRKKSEEKLKYIDQNFPFAWKLCRNPQMLYILTHHIELEKLRNFFELIDEMCFQFNEDNQASREYYHVENSNKLEYLAYKASSNSSITLITDAASNNIQAVQGMMLVKPYENNGQPNRSQIQSHFINPLIQDHYTARYLKEEALDNEVNNFLDELLFPGLSKSANVDTTTSDRNHLIRRLCCSNVPGRRHINEYFWKRMKEDVQRHCVKSNSLLFKSKINGIHLIMDLVEAFSEENRQKQSTEPAQVDPRSEYGCQELCEDMRKMTKTFCNVNFTTIHSIFQTCKLTESCEFEIKNANMSIEDIGKEQFKQILSAIKNAQLKMYELEIQNVTTLDVASLKELKVIFQCIVGELKIDIDDSKKAHELHGKFTNLKGLPRIFKNTQNQGIVDITIFDAAENSYTPLKTHRTYSQMYLNPHVS